jgi:hypothetical protein
MNFPDLFFRQIILLAAALMGCNFLATAAAAESSYTALHDAALHKDTRIGDPEVLSDTEIANLLLKRGRPIRMSKENGLPLVCTVNFDVISLLKVDEAKEMFQIDFYSWVSWKDSRLAFDPKEFGIDRINVAPSVAWETDKLWNPMIEFMNLADQKITDQSLRIESNGTCRWTIR